MSWLKSIFGNEDKEKKVSSLETPLQNNPDEDISIFETLPVDEVDYGFQSLGWLTGSVEPKGVTEMEGAVHTQPKDVVQPNGTTQPKKVVIPKILVEDTKLTIILVENTEAVAKNKDKLQQIVNSLVTSGRVCVINYGQIVRQGKIVEAKSFDCKNLLSEEFIEDNACLYDALNALRSVVEENYKKTEELKNKKIRIKSIEIIGIGRCFDNCSITSREIAIESFFEVACRLDVTTKYFCLSEENFIDAATIGFRSIGAINRNYISN